MDVMATVVSLAVYNMADLVEDTKVEEKDIIAANVGFIAQV